MAIDYVKRGRCRRTPEGRAILPDGDSIDKRAYLGKNLTDALLIGTPVAAKRRIQALGRQNEAPVCCCIIYGRLNINL